MKFRKDDNSWKILEGWDKQDAIAISVVILVILFGVGFAIIDWNMSHHTHDQYLEKNVTVCPFMNENLSDLDYWYNDGDGRLFLTKPTNQND